MSKKGQIKISKAVWEGYTPIEQEYIKSRIGKDDLPIIKMILKYAKEQLPGYVKIYGKGFVEDKEGNTWLFSGPDTRKFYKVEESGQKNENNIKSISLELGITLYEL